MRPGIEVRPAEPSDMTELVELCLSARAESAVGSHLCTSDAETLARQIGALTATPGGTILVARSDDALVGLMLGRVVGPNPFTDEVSLAVEALYVGAGHRRRGIGHQLMVGAAEIAERAGAEHVYTAPIPGARGMQRFFVQLGFAPAAAHRVSSTSALQRRLADTGVNRRHGSRGIDDLIARRRQSRLDAAASQALPPVVDQAGRRAAISRHVRRAVQTRRDIESSIVTS